MGDEHADHQTIRAYYQAFRDKDRAALERILTDGFRHAGPFGEFVGRDAMLEAIWPGVEGNAELPWAADIEVFGAHPGYMVRYRHEGGGGGRFAEYFWFEGERIAEIEVYLGAGAVPGMG